MLCRRFIAGASSSIERICQAADAADFGHDFIEGVTLKIGTEILSAREMVVSRSAGTL